VGTRRSYFRRADREARDVHFLFAYSTPEKGEAFSTSELRTNERGL
jgi:hypothetical protein